MNILFVSRNEFNSLKGGIERVSNILAKALINKGYNVYFLSLEHKESLIYNTYSFPYADINSADNRLFYAKLLSKLNIDIVINQYGLHQESFLFLDIDNPAIKKISVLHNDPLLRCKSYHKYILAGNDKLKLIKLLLSPFLAYRFYLYRKRHYKRLLNLSTNIVLLSPNYQNALKIFQSKKVVTIGNPTDIIEEYNYNKSKQILYVGRLDRYEKSPQHLLYIWERISKKFPDWELIFVGDGPDRRYMESVIVSLRLERCTITGFQDPIEYYKNASIFAMTSSNEGFPMVLPEAMIHSCVPIIYNSYAAASDIIDDGINGILVKKFDRKQFANKLSLLIENTEMREKMAKSAHEKAQTFHIDNIIEKWENLFK